MIVKKQAEDLAKYFQIDSFTVMREYLQILFLSHLYQSREGDKIYFKGGTAIRLLLGSSRFSEDLDFSTTYARAQIKKIIKKIEKSIEKELSNVKISLLYLGKNTSRYRFKYQAEDFKYPLIIRIDINQVKKIKEIRTTPLVTKYPIVVFPLINHLSETEILAEKLCALFTRAKGRDFFDVWFLLEKAVKINKKLLAEKLKERGQSLNKAKILQKIEGASRKRLKRDLQQFLPSSQRKIVTMLKSRLKIQLEKLL